MEVQIKTFSGLAHGNHVIVMIRGIVAIGGFSYILDRVAEATRPLLDCKVLIDFQDSTFQFLPSDIGGFVDSFNHERWPHNNKVALVSAPDAELFRQLSMVGESLWKLHLDADVFCDTKEAISWLAQIR